MKRTVQILFLVLVCTAVYSQDSDPGRDFRAGVYANAGYNLPVRLTTKYITEETSPWHGRQLWSGGAHLSFMVTEFYRLEIAPRYSWHKIGFELSPPIYQEKTIYTETFELVSVPVTFKRYLTGNFFISAGTIIDFTFNGKPLWIDPQSGFGLTLGAGKEYRVKDFMIDLSPAAELHSVVPFAEKQNQQRLFVVSLRIGISYSPGPGMNPLKKEDNLNVKPDPEL